MNLDFRDANRDDVGFITSTWLNNLWNSKYYKCMKKSVFMEEHHQAIRSRMASFSCIVACDPTDPYTIFGYIVYSKPNVVQFCYVKGVFRKLGIGKMLLNQAFGESISEIEISHLTDHAKKLMQNHPINFNPYKFFERGNYEN